MATIPAALFLSPSLALASISSPLPQGLRTVVLDSPVDSAGFELYDVSIGGSKMTFPAVKLVQKGSIAATSGVKEGMILLNDNSATKATSDLVEFRIKNGPYPIILKFYNLAVETESTNDDAVQALAQVQKQAGGQQMSDDESVEKFLSPTTGGATSIYEQRLAVKTVGKAENGCPSKAKRGDTVEISYDARIASPDGPLYDSSSGRGGSVKFVLGKGEAIRGVDIGVTGMCVGETREMFIPPALGYGKFGSQVFDIPGDVRLWWRVELMDVTKKDNKASWPYH